MRTIGLLIGVLLLTSNVLTAQKETKWNDAITELENEEFVQEYLRLKELIERDIKEFKIEVENGTISNADINLVKLAFEESKVSFDQILDRMKYSFTIKSERQKIRNNPSTFTSAFKSDLKTSFESYQNNCQRKMHAMTSSFVGAFGLGEITLILGLVKEVYEIIDSQLAKTRKMTEEYFENKLISKLRLHEWESY